MKTVLVTGASKGIGAEIAKTFANYGYMVGINYNKSFDKAKELYDEITKNGGNATLLKADVGNEKEVKKMVDEFVLFAGHIDVLINNAGVCSKSLFVDEDEETTKKVIETNLFGTINASKQVLKHMTNNQSGKIINISSIWGNLGASMEATYSASKAGVIGLTKSLAKEYGYSGINVNCICPGVIDTDMNNNLSSQEKNDLESQILAQRFGRPQEVAELALFLAEKGDYITGQIITIDGGFGL